MESKLSPILAEPAHYTKWRAVMQGYESSGLIKPDKVLRTRRTFVSSAPEIQNLIMASNKICDVTLQNKPITLLKLEPAQPVSHFNSGYDCKMTAKEKIVIKAVR
jgi:hypothetical protein